VIPKQFDHPTIFADGLEDIAYRGCQPNLLGNDVRLRFGLIENDLHAQNSPYSDLEAPNVQCLGQSSIARADVHKTTTLN
jgi:hypothetical protein